MRFWAIIISMYIAGLAFMPCPDALTCSDEISHNSNEANDHDHSEDEDDLCSPFCICTCCGCSGFFIVMPDFFIMKHKPNISVLDTPYDSNFNTSYNFSFWQPPKIS